MDTLAGGWCHIAPAPEAGAEAGALAGFGLALLSLIMWLALRGTRGAWQFTFGAILHSLATVSIGARFVGHVHPFAFLDDLNNTILNNLATAANGYEHAMGFWFHQAAHLQGWIGDEIWKLARDVAHFDEWLIKTWLPTYVHGITDILHSTTRAATHTITRIEKRTIYVTRYIKAETHAAVAATVPAIAIPYAWQWHWIHKHWKALVAAVTAAGAFAGGLALPWVHIFPRVRVLERFEVITRKRITRLEALFGVTAMAAAMANVFGLPNWRCLTRGNVGRMTRALCGIPAHVLNDVLGLLLDFFILADICQVVVLLEDGLAFVQPAITGFVTVLDGALCHGDYAAAPTVPVPALYLAPVDPAFAP